MPLAELSRGPIVGRLDATAFLRGLAALMAELESVLAAETAHLAAGRIRAGLAEEARKGTLVARYLLALEHVKKHAVALARFAPAEVKALRAAGASFEGAVSRNQAVVATVRAVSEGLVRGLGSDVSRRSRPSGYGPGAASAPIGRMSASPLVLSASL